MSTKVVFDVYQGDQLVWEGDERVLRWLDGSNTRVVNYKYRCYPLVSYQNENDGEYINIAGINYPRLRGELELGCIAEAAGSIDLPDAIYCDTSGHYCYVLCDGDGDDVNNVINALEQSGFDVSKHDVSNRPADNGVIYEWYIRLNGDCDRNELMEWSNTRNGHVSTSPAYLAADEVPRTETGFDNQFNSTRKSIDASYAALGKLLSGQSDDGVVEFPIKVHDDVDETGALRRQLRQACSDLNFQKATSGGIRLELAEAVSREKNAKSEWALIRQDLEKNKKIAFDRAASLEITTRSLEEQIEKLKKHQSSTSMERNDDRPINKNLSENKARVAELEIQLGEKQRDLDANKARVAEVEIQLGEKQRDLDAAEKIMEEENPNRLDERVIFDRLRRLCASTGYTADEIASRMQMSPKLSEEVSGLNAKLTQKRRVQASQSDSDVCFLFKGMINILSHINLVPGSEDFVIKELSDPKKVLLMIIEFRKNGEKPLNGEKFHGVDGWYEWHYNTGIKGQESAGRLYALYHSGGWHLLISEKKEQQRVDPQRMNRYRRELESK